MKKRVKELASNKHRPSKVRITAKDIYVPKDSKLSDLYKHGCHFPIYFFR